MKRAAILFTFVLLSTLPVLAAQWARTIGGPLMEEALSVTKTRDGGCVFCGYSSSFGKGDQDIWVVKLTAAGELDWQKYIKIDLNPDGEGDSGDDQAASIRQTDDGGYILAGWIYWGGFGFCPPDLFVVRLSAAGEVVWQYYVGDEDIGIDGHTEESALSIYPRPGGDFVVAGNQRRHTEEGDWNYSVYLLDFSADGLPLWQVKFGGDGDESANCVNGTSSGGMIVAGYTTSFGAGNRDFWVLKLDSQGSPLWQKTFGGPRDDYARSIQQTSDGGFIVAGVTKSFGAGDYDAWVLKLRSNGSKQWQKTYGGKRGDYAHAVRQTADGGYIIAGSTGSFGHGGMDFWLLKLNSAGGIQWEKAYGGPKDESAFAVDILPEGDFYVAGRSESFGSGMYDAMVLRVNKNGSIAAGCSAFAKNTNAVKNTSDAKVKTTTITTYPGYVFEYGSVLWPLVLTAALLNVPCH